MKEYENEFLDIMYNLKSGDIGKLVHVISKNITYDNLDLFNQLTFLSLFKDFKAGNEEFLDEYAKIINSMDDRQLFEHILNIRELLYPLRVYLELKVRSFRKIFDIIRARFANKPFSFEMIQRLFEVKKVKWDELFGSGDIIFCSDEGNPNPKDIVAFINENYLLDLGLKTAIVGRFSTEEEKELYTAKKRLKQVRERQMYSKKEFTYGRNEINLSARELPKHFFDVLTGLRETLPCYFLFTYYDSRKKDEYYDTPEFTKKLKDAYSYLLNQEKNWDLTYSKPEVLVSDLTEYDFIYMQMEELGALLHENRR